MMPVVGSISGLLSWFIAHSPEIASVAGAIGAIATAGIAVIGFTRIFFRGAADLCGRVRQLVRNRAQRRAWKRHEPADDHLDFHHDR